MNALIQINDLIDKHEDYTLCQGCPLCKKIEKLRQGLDRNGVPNAFKKILQKGEEMNRSDINTLLEGGVPKGEIRKALKYNPMEFAKLMKNLGLARDYQKEEVKVDLTAEEYYELKDKGMTDSQIGKEKKIHPHTLRNWKHRRGIKARAKSEKPTQPDAAKIKPPESKPSQESEIAEYETVIAELKTKIEQYENLNSACDDIESELESLKEKSEGYLSQLGEARHQLIQKDYELQNNKKALENVNKAMQRMAKENQVLKELVKAQSMAQLEFL